MDWKEACNLGGLWTNEKHLNFLNSMEATFVRTMLENGGVMYAATALHPPLDRYLPDRSDSTRDLQSHRNTRRKRVYFPVVSGDVLHSNMISDAGSRKCNKRRSRRTSDSSEDQVVPQLGITKAGKIKSSDVEVAVAVADTDEEALSVSRSHRKRS